MENSRLIATSPTTHELPTMHAANSNLVQSQDVPATAQQTQETNIVKNSLLVKRERTEEEDAEAQPPTKRMRTSLKVVTTHPIVIVEGYNKPQNEKVPGGKDNRKPIQTHIIGIETRCLPAPYNKNFANLLVRASLMGFKRLSVNREETHLTRLEQVPISKGVPSAVPGHLQVYFEGLIVNYSSHNHGQKLFLRFSLIDDSQGEETEICFTDGATFETITKRGIEKQIRKLKKDGSSSPSSPIDTPPSSTSTTPTTSSNTNNHVFPVTTSSIIVNPQLMATRFTPESPQAQVLSNEFERDVCIALVTLKHQPVTD